MKTLNYRNQQFQAEKIIKTDKDIIGQDTDGNVVFSFRGISDFSGFTLEADQIFDVQPPDTGTLQKQIYDLTTQLVTLEVI
jgi:hypothetical protein